MTELTTRHELRSASEDAGIYWHTLMSGGGASEAERLAFQQWLHARPENSELYAELEEMSATIGELQSLLPGAGNPQPSVRSRMRRSLGLALAAGVAALAIGVFFNMQHTPDYVADLGEIRRLELPDGSLLTLSSSSQVRQRFDTRLRSLDLEAGQAFFEVRKEANRPFVVHAGNVTVRAVGTKFDVVRRPSGLTVTVLEGRVAVERLDTNTAPDTAGSSPVYVSAGEQVSVDYQGTMRTRRQEETSSAGTWRSDQLVYREEPLLDVLTDLGRYLPERVVLADAELGTLRVSAVVNTREPYNMLEAITRSLGLEQQRSADTITLRSSHPD